jgi:hypothetical protein
MATPRYAYSTATNAPGASSIPRSTRSTRMLARQLAAIPLVALLYTAATPFAPVAWALGLYDSTIVDRVLAGIVMLSACYFQWRIGGLTQPLAIVVPGSDAPVVRNGRVERAPAVGFVWYPDNYWMFAVAEAGLLFLAEFGPSEMLRRAIVCCVVGGLWAVGYSATPEAMKRWAYGHMKTWVFWMLLDEFRRVGWGNQGGYGRRRRY